MGLEDFAQGLVRWYKYGYMAVNQQVFDVGIQTAAAIRRIMQGYPVEQAGASDDQANGNGSLMRDEAACFMASGHRCRIN